jgi:hypothetical protein
MIWDKGLKKVQLRIFNSRNAIRSGGAMALQGVGMHECTPY